MLRLICLTRRNPNSGDYRLCNLLALVVMRIAKYSWFIAMCGIPFLGLGCRIINLVTLNGKSSLQRTSKESYSSGATGGRNDVFNPTVFGKILRRESPCLVLAETSDILVFEDIHPRALLHALAIPKTYVQNVFSLGEGDIDLLLHMQEMGLKIIEEKYPEAFADDDYILGFHVPPFNSVNHLHLHVLAPASKMTTYHRHVKYNVGLPWCTGIATVIERLRSGKTPVTYL